MNTTINTITRDDKIQLGTLCTRDEAGRHFTDLHSAEWLDRMEAAGLITIERPTHDATDIPYSQEYWAVEVSAEVGEWFDEHGNLIDG